MSKKVHDISYQHREYENYDLSATVDGRLFLNAFRHIYTELLDYSSFALAAKLIVADCFVVPASPKLF